MNQLEQIKSVLADTFTHFWEQRQPRERQFLMAAGAFFVLFCVYMIGIDPALTGRDDLRKSLPGLHQQVSEMQQYAQQLAEIPVMDNRHEITRELVEASLTQVGLKAQTLSINDAVVRAQFAATSMSALQTWLLEMQKSNGLFVEEIKISALEGGVISANVVLHQSGTTVGN